MSAYMVGKPHIDAMVTLALYGPKRERAVSPDTMWSPLRSPYIMQDRNADLTADQWGHMLWLENYKSVSYRYPDCTPESGVPGPIGFVPADIEAYTFLRSSPVPTIGQALALLDGYEYQASEHPGWPTSPAYRFCEQLRKRLWQALAVYDAKAWEWEGN